MKTFRKAALGAALAALVAAPPAGSAATNESAVLHPAGQVTYATSLVDVDHPGGEYDGTLNVTIAEDGTIAGFYRPADTGRVIQVTGGLTGDKVFLNIGWSGAPITGTYDHGRIIGYTFNGHDTERFVATPTQPNL
jgi:hypothetical protein